MHGYMYKDRRTYIHTTSILEYSFAFGYQRSKFGVSISLAHTASVDVGYDRLYILQRCYRRWKVMKNI